MLSIPKYPEQYAQLLPAIFYLLCCAFQHHVMLATCTTLALFQLPPLFLRRQRNSSGAINVYPLRNDPPACPLRPFTGVSSCHRLRGESHLAHMGSNTGLCKPLPHSCTSLPFSWRWRQYVLVVELVSNHQVDNFFLYGASTVNIFARRCDIEGYSPHQTIQTIGACIVFGSPLINISQYCPILEMSFALFVGCKAGAEAAVWAVWDLLVLNCQVCDVRGVNCLRIPGWGRLPVWGGHCGAGRGRFSPPLPPHTPWVTGLNPSQQAMEPSLLSFSGLRWGVYPRVQGSWLTGAYGRGKSLPRRPMEHSIAILCGDLRPTFGTDLVCAELEQVKTIYCESWL